MKLLILAFLFGLAAATSFEDVWERERDNTLFHFMKGMKMAGPLRVALGEPDNRELDEVEDDIKTELGKKLKEQLDEALKKLKEILDKKEEVKDAFLERIKEIKEKMKDLHMKISDQAKELLEKLGNKVKDYFRKLLDKLTKNEKRALDQATELAEQLDLKEILRRIKEKIKEHISVDKIREYIENFKDKLGEFGKILIEKLKNHEGLEALRKLIRHILDKDNRESRSIKEHWERLKDFLKEKHLEFKEKFKGFVEWLKDAVSKGLDVAKDKATAMKQIAKEFIEHSKKISKEVAAETLEALRPYKDDMGELWNQLKEKVNEILRRDD